MWPNSSSNRRRLAVRGFTLLEAMVSLLLLVIVLIVAMTMLFQMRAFAERQQYFMLPRQSARRATEYLSYYLAGATDINYINASSQVPNALIMYYNNGGVLTQASFNNLTGLETGNAPRIIAANPPTIPTAIASTNFGDLGTDTITLIAPFNPSRYQVFAPYPAANAAADLFVNFRGGCATSDAANRAAFKAATGDDGSPTGGSTLLMLVDNSGSWTYVRIPTAGYAAGGLCSDVTTFKNIEIVVNTTAAGLTPPHGTPGLTDPVFLVAGLQVISFRVLTDPNDGIPKLQQKLGLFDPATDNPGTAFTNVMENVEDLQIAYMYPDGAVWNTVNQTIHNGAAGSGCATAECDNQVPVQAGPNSGAVPATVDIQNVVGLRFSVTGRSPLLPIGARQLTNVDARGSLAPISTDTLNQHFRPASEDHTVTDPPPYDQFDHYRATATLMLRNRIPRG